MLTEKWHHIKGDLGLVLVTLIWGTTFVITEVSLEQVPPLLYLAMRFMLAFGLLVLVFGKKLRAVGWQELKTGMIVGAILFAGFATQTIGMLDEDTTASKAAFITGLSVILTPLLAMVFLKKKPNWATMVGAFLAFGGLAVLALNGEGGSLVSWGDLLILACAVAFAGHIIAVGKFTNTMDTGVLTTIQIGVAGLLCGIAGLVLEPIPAAVSREVWWGLVYMGLAATAGVLFLQTWAQKFTTPTRTAIIFTLEPVFAAFFAYWFLAEALTGRMIVGGVLILAGILLAELKGE
ncbi:MAG: DMT family transporter [Clostridia bacterium]|nr:DMT family transporter [Clostridia bacterium]